jgi:hypothetical protein
MWFSFLLLRLPVAIFWLCGLLLVLLDLLIVAALNVLAGA